MPKLTPCLADRLARHPELHKRIESILDLVESEGSEVRLADEAERQVIDLMRQLGHDVLTGWAEGREAVETDCLDKSSDWRRAGKKNSTGIVVTE